jgi:hypothetical protein
LEFGGWPDVSELPIQAMSDKHCGIMIEKCTKKKNVVMPEFVKNESDKASLDVSDIKQIECTNEEKEKSSKMEGEDKLHEIVEDNEVDSSDDEAWDLFKIMSSSEVTCDCPIKCSTENCPRPAAVGYISKAKPSEKWYACLDCQVSYMFHNLAPNQPIFAYSHLIPFERTMNLGDGLRCVNFP